MKSEATAEQPSQREQNLSQNLLSSAQRQLALLRAFGAGISFAPTLDDRLALARRTHEELSALERADGAYAELVGSSLIADAEPKLATLALPRSWPEACVACLLISLATRVDLEDRPAQDRATLRMLAREWERVSAMRAALREIDPAQDVTSHVSAQFISHWVNVALASLQLESTRRSFLTALGHELRPLGLTYSDRSAPC
jgi:hypothetical protein